VDSKYSIVFIFNHIPYIFSSRMQHIILRCLLERHVGVYCLELLDDVPLQTHSWPVYLYVGSNTPIDITQSQLVTCYNYNGTTLQFLSSGTR